jgi:hypothetical protein
MVGNLSCAGEVKFVMPALRGTQDKLPPASRFVVSSIQKPPGFRLESILSTVEGPE